MSARPLPQGRPAAVLELDFGEHAYRAGWTDGLPVVEPTPERVAAAVAASGRDPLEVVAVLPPGQGVATVEALAANAVMAGAAPEHLPVVLAAVRAVADPRFNLQGIQATTSPVTPVVLVNGPVARELEFNGGHNCFGQGNRSNAVVGRALRFCLLNVGYGTPGDADMSTQGQPGKYTFCFAENEAASPWGPHHVERGFAADASCVTVFQGGMLLNVLDFGSKTAASLLDSLAAALSTPNSNNLQLGNGDLLIVLCPEHAALLAREGVTRDDVRRHVHAHARVPAGRLPAGILECVLEWRADRYRSVTPETPIALVDEPSHVQVAVAGGVGSHSACIPGFGDGWSVCVEI